MIELAFGLIVGFLMGYIVAGYEYDKKLQHLERRVKALELNK